MSESQTSPPLGVLSSPVVQAPGGMTWVEAHTELGLGWCSRPMTRAEPPTHPPGGLLDRHWPRSLPEPTLCCHGKGWQSANGTAWFDSDAQRIGIVSLPQTPLPKGALSTAAREAQPSHPKSLIRPVCPDSGAAPCSAPGSHMPFLISSGISRGLYSLRKGKVTSQYRPCYNRERKKKPRRTPSLPQGVLPHFVLRGATIFLSPPLAPSAQMSLKRRLGPEAKSFWFTPAPGLLVGR